MGELRMPALRERVDDIPMLANYFAAKYSDKCNRRVLGISPETQKFLLAYDWPGNVRELENAIERAIVMGMTEDILPEDLPEAILESKTPEASEPGSGYHESVTARKNQVIV